MLYGFKQPIYQETEYMDLENYAVYPKEIEQFLTKNMLFTTSSLEKDQQGRDFFLEGQIKRRKLMASKGDVSNKTWRQVSVRFDGTESIVMQFKDVKFKDG